MQTFKPGDYVKYDGKLSQYNSSIARIIEFKTYNDIEYLSLLDLKDKGNFLAEISEIRHVELDEHHLKKLGFEKEVINSRLRFKKNNIIISKANIYISHSDFYFFSEFCVGDFTNEDVNIKQYVEGGKFNSEKFYLDYPKAAFVSELFNFLNDMNVNFNELDILMG